MTADRAPTPPTEPPTPSRLRRLVRRLDDWSLGRDLHCTHPDCRDCRDCPDAGAR